MKSTVWKSRLRWVVMFLAVASLSACGGGGSEPEPTAIAPLQQMAVLRSDVTLIDELQLPFVKINATGDTVTLPPTIGGETKVIQAGRTIHIPAGLDARFPMGLSLVAQNVSNAPDGTQTVSVQPATDFSQVATSMNVRSEGIAIGAENYLGVIAPSSLWGDNTRSVPQKVGLIQPRITDLNGALTIRPIQTGFLEKSMEIVNLLGDDTVKAGTISLNKTWKLPDFLKESASKTKPFGRGGEAAVSVNLTLSDLKLTKVVDADVKYNIPYKLQNIKFKLEGAMTTDVKFSGGVEMSIGAFNSAWKEVEDQSIKILGFDTKLSGLGSTDKFGKVPLAGLIFSVPCATGCPTTVGGTQAAVRSAKSGGVIIWVYLNLDGTLSFDGEVGLKANTAFDVGFEGPENGEFKSINNIKPAKLGFNVLEAPYVNGTVTGSANIGFSVDVDSFVAGVRFANLSLFAGGRQSIDATLNGSHALPDFDSDWRWSGEFCASTQIGAGLKFSSGVKFKIGDDNSVGFERNDSFPDLADTLIPGRHGLWWTFDASRFCLPKPSITAVSTTCTLNEIMWSIEGENLPSDLIFQEWPNSCDAPPEVTLFAKDDGAKATARCVAKPQVGQPFEYVLASAKAENMHGGLVRNAGHCAALATANAYPALPMPGQEVEFWLTQVYEAIKTVVWNFGVGIAEQVASASKGVSQKITQLFDREGLKTVVATLKDATGKVLGTAIVQVDVVGVSSVITLAQDDRTAPATEIAPDSTTDDVTPVFRGTIAAVLPAGYEVRLFRNGETDSFGVATVNGLSWSFTFPANQILSAGIQSVTAGVVLAADGSTAAGPRSAPYVIKVQAAGVSGVDPMQVMRGKTSVLTFTGQGLPISGMSINVPGHVRNICQINAAGTSATSFNANCTLFQLGAQSVQIIQGSRVLGELEVAVSSNVADVTWASGSSTVFGKGTVKFGEMITYRVTGQHLLADAALGFAVERCGVSNTEVGIGSDIQRTYQCWFNNEAGAVAGQMSGVVKDAPNGQVLYTFRVPVETAPIDTNNSVVVSWDLGSVGTPVQGRGTNPRTVAINGGVEIEGFLNNAMVDVDVSNDKVRLFNFRSYAGAPGSAVFDASVFNGLVLRVPSGANWTFSSAGVGSANTLSGLTASRLDTEPQRLAINLAGLGYNAGTVLDVGYNRNSQVMPLPMLTAIDGFWYSKCSSGDGGNSYGQTILKFYGATSSGKFTQVLTPGAVYSDSQCTQTNYSWPGDVFDVEMIESFYVNSDAVYKLIWSYRGIETAKQTLRLKDGHLYCASVNTEGNSSIGFPNEADVELCYKRESW